MKKPPDKTLRDHAIAVGVAHGLDAKSAATRHDLEHGAKRPCVRWNTKRGPSAARVKATTRSQRP